MLQNCAARDTWFSKILEKSFLTLLLKNIAISIFWVNMSSLDLSQGSLEEKDLSALAESIAIFLKRGFDAQIVKKLYFQPIRSKTHNVRYDSKEGPHNFWKFLSYLGS